MTDIKNLTPHNVVIVINDDMRYVIATSGMVARCSSTTETIGEVNGIPLTKTKYGEVIGLPE